jgi:DNA processing protein
MTPQPARDLEAWLRIALVPRVGLVAQRKLLEHFGSPREALAATSRDVAAVLGNASAARQFARGADRAMVEQALAWSAIAGNHIVTFVDDAYPQALREIHDPPPVLYVRGRTELLGAAALAIVGSRNPTPQGARDAEAFAKALADAGLAIVSGLALGIDAAAHRGGLAGASASIGVLGTGVDRIYPDENRELGERLAAEGCLVSELALGTAPHSRNFPRRNRLISGMSRGVLVVEAATRSGSLITAREALDQGRDVFAIPGSIHAPLSKGCHALIKEGAKLVECVADVLQELGLAAPAADPAEEHERAPRDAVLRAMGRATLSIDQLVVLTGLAAPQLAAHLARLEMHGRIAALPGGRFQRAEERVIE